MAGVSEAAPLSAANADLDRVCTNTLAGLVDRTASANNAVVSDVTVGNDALGTGSSAVYFGMNEVWTTLVVNVGTAGTVGTVSWTYWNGAWAALAATDNTNHFKTGGTNTVTFTPPGDWAETEVDAVNCTGSRYFVRAVTSTNYATLPLATQVSAIEYNLKVKVQDELGNTQAGLSSDAFVVLDGTVSTVFASRDLGAGVYELALDMGGSDHNFNLRVDQDGYARAAALATGSLTTTLTDLTGSPLSLAYALKVVPDAEMTGRQVITGATVTAGDALAITCTEGAGGDQGSYYCAVPLAHTSTDVRVQKDGFVTKTLTSAWVDRRSHADAQAYAPTRPQLLSGTMPSGRHGGGAVWTGTDAYIFGGQAGGVPSDEILRYDPATNTWTTMSAKLPTARQFASAAWSGTYAYIFGGQKQAGATNEILRYDPLFDKITTMTATLPENRYHTVAVWAGSYAYILGGIGGTGLGSDDILRYDPVGDAISDVATMPGDRWRASAVYDGSDWIYYFGGMSGVHHDEIFRFAPGNNTVQTITTVLPGDRARTSAIWDGTSAYIFGGFDGALPVSDIVKFNPTSGVTTMGEWLPTARYGVAAVWDGSKALLMGGFDLGSINQVVRYDPSSTHSITTLATTLPAARTGLNTFTSGTDAYLLGGGMASIWRYDLSLGTITTLAETLPAARSSTTVVWDGSTNAYIIGGNAGGARKDILRYRPSTGAVETLTDELPTARDGLAGCWANGKAYVFGGWDLGPTSAIVRFDPSAVSNRVTTLAATLPSGRTNMGITSDGTNCYIFGGWDGVQKNQILKFDASTETLTTMTATLPTAREKAAVVWEGSVAYVIGGWDGTKLDDIVQYDPVADTVTLLEERLPSGRDGSAAAWYVSRAFAFGGGLAGGDTNQIIQYETLATARTIMGTLPSARAYAAVGWNGQHAYIFGGKLTDATRTDEILRYNPTLRTVRTMTAKLPSARSYVSVVWDSRDLPSDGCDDGCFYLFGGLSTLSLDEIVRYNPKTDVLTVMDAVLPSARDGTSAAFDGTYAYIFGGVSQIGPLDTILRYDPLTDTVATMTATLPTARNDTAAFWDGTYAYILGGHDGAYLNQIVRYDPALDTATTLAATLPSGRIFSTAAWDGTHAYLFGGKAGSSSTNQIVRFTPSTGAALELSSAYPGDTLPSARNGAGAVWDGTQAYVFGGHTGSAFLQDVVGFDPDQNLDLQYGFKVTGVSDETGASLSSVTVSTGDAFATSCTESEGAWYCQVPLADSAFVVRAAKDGYVTNEATSFASDRTGHTDAQRTVAVSGLQFGLKVTGVTDELGNALSSLTLTAGDAFAVSCVESGGAWYCPVPVAHTETDVRAAKDGYVTRTAAAAYTDRDDATDSQETATVSGVQFGYKVTAVSDELSNALASAVVHAGNSQGTSCTSSGGAWYCAVPLADTSLVVRAAQDGYVTDTASSFASDRTAASDAQVAGTVTNVRFAYKVTGVTNEISASLAGVTVRAGNAQGTLCSESAGAWYCAVPLADTTTTIQAVKDGYVTDTASSFASDRTVATDAQVTAAVSTVKFAFKVTGITSEASLALSGATVSTGDAYAVSCSESASAWYCAVPLAHTGLAVSVVKDGYVTNTATSFASDRTADTQAQQTVAVAGILYTVKLTVATETSLTGVDWEKSVNGAAFSAVTPEATSGNVAYFAQTTGEADVVFQAGKYSVTADSGAAFTASAAAQTTRTLLLVAQLTGLSTTPTNSGSTVQTTYTLGLTIAHAWPADGRLNVTFPAGFTIGSPAATLTGASGSATASVAGQTVSVARSGGSATSGGAALTLALTQITNPVAVGVTGTFGVSLMNAAWVELDEGTAPAVTITGVLTSLSTTAGNLSVGATGTYTFGFTTASDWPADGKIRITFPAAYTFGTPAATLTGADGTATVSVSGTTVTVARAGDGALTPGSTAVTLVLTEVTNGPNEGSTGTFALLLRTSADFDLDSGLAPAVTLVTNPLNVRNLASTTHASGTWSASRTIVVSWQAPTDLTVVGYSWGWDADPDSVVDGTSLTTSLSSVTDGTHAFKIKAKNAGGTWGPILSYANMGVDATAPDAPSISSSHVADACTSDASVDFSWGSGDATSGLDATQPFRYGLGGSGTLTSDTSATYASLSDGAHTLSVTAYDAAGNSAKSTYRVLVDTTAPKTTLAGPAYANAATFTLTVSATDSCGTLQSILVEQRVGSGAWQGFETLAASGTVTVSAGSDGTYDFRARATDAAGNVGAASSTPQATTVVDRVVPGAATNVQARPQAAASVKVTWTAATDDRSGVDGYRVYRVDLTGNEALASSSLVKTTEFVDTGQTDGAQLRYAVRAVDRAANVGASATSGLVIVDGRGPIDSPRGLTAEGLNGALVLIDRVQLRWEAVLDAADYAVYFSESDTITLDDAHRVGSTSARVFDVPGPKEGPHYYAVTARDVAGNDGPPATLAFIFDPYAPAARASSPAESGPAVAVSWKATDPGSGLAEVKLWALESDREPVLIYATSRAEGTVSFYGVEGHTYHFFAVAKDRVGHETSKRIEAASADATTRVVSSLSLASPQAVASVPAGGGDPSQPFYAEDGDGDGFPEAFVDPSNRVSSMRIMPQDGKSLFVLGENRDGGLTNPLALWDPATNDVHPITLVLPTHTGQLVKVAGGRLELSVTVENKQGWIYIPVKDAAPGRDIESVWRSDGVLVPEGQYWRIPGYVVVMDDPVTVYRIVYAPEPQHALGLVLFGLALLGAGAAVGWVTWPSVARLEARPPRRAGLGWALRFCAECQEALPRAVRLLRFRHRCGLGSRLRSQRHNGLGSTLSRRLAMARRAAHAVRLSQRLSPRRRPPPRIPARRP